MKIKALIQNHYPERIPNLEIMVNDLVKNGVAKEDIGILIDHQQVVPQLFIKSTLDIQMANHSMPINWWHGIASVLNCDYVALLCDDLTLRPKSIKELTRAATAHKEVDVFGYEGGKFAPTENPYTDTKSHTSEQLEPADFLIRFYFAKPQAFVRALELYNQTDKSRPIHDDILLSLLNTCAIVPTTEKSGWDELSEHGVAYSKRPDHYDERNALIRRFR